MAQIPQGLKKRLEENLATLTPKEAGCLFVIYAHEAEAKYIRVFDYPSIKALEVALRQRSAAQDEAEAKKAFAVLQGFTFLAGLWETVNTEGLNLFLTTALDALRLLSTVMLLLHQDTTAVLIRSMRGVIGQSLPVSEEDFARAVAWENGERLWMLSEVAESMVEREEDVRWNLARETLPDFQLPDETQITETRTPEARVDVSHAALQRLRRTWAEGQGDWFLRDVFSGDKKRLDAWINDGQIDYLYSDAERGARQAAIVVDLTAKLEVGELNGGLALDHPDALYAPVLIDEFEGVIPAWAALRILWRPYVTNRGYRVYAGVTLTSTLPYLADEIRARDDQPVAAEELATLTADFLNSCRRRLWGKQLPAEFDKDMLAYLTDFLTQSKNPLLHLNAPDLGKVDFAAWSKYDARGLDWITGSAATTASLVAAGFEKLVGKHLVDEYFYAYPRAKTKQLNIAHALDLMNNLDTGRQPFTYRRKGNAQDVLVSLPALLGLDLLTQFETNVRALQKAINRLASIRAALDTVSDHYFGGLSILSKALDAHLQQTESYRREAEHYVKSWLDRLAVYPWNVDTSTINPGEPEVNEDMVKDIIDSWLKHTRRKTAIKNETNFLE